MRIKAFYPVEKKWKVVSHENDIHKIKMRLMMIAYCVVINFTMCLSNYQVRLCLKRIAEEYFIDNVVLIIYWEQPMEHSMAKKLLGGLGVSKTTKFFWKMILSRL